MKTHEKKRDFIQILSMMTDTQINDYIKTHVLKCFCKIVVRDICKSIKQT